MKKSILVTGGAGFIGSNLCKALIEQGHFVQSLDNYSSGSTKNHINGVTYIKGSTKNIFSLIENVPDIIYHLGEYSRVENSFKDILKVLEYNKTGTLNVLEYARKYNSRLIYAGSSTKFGDNGSNSSPYAWSKSSNVELIKNYGTWFNLDYAITYFYNVYGPGEVSTGDYSTVIGIFKNKIQKNQELSVVSPGTQKRNFTHINDTIQGLLLMLEDAKGDGYGIGSDTAYSIIEIAELFNSKYNMIPAREGNRLTAEVCNSKIKELGWQENYNLKEYIQGA